MVVKIETLKDSYESEVCLLEEGLFSSLELNEHTMYSLHAGQRTIKAFVRSVVSSDAEVYFSEKHIKNMLVYQGEKINIWRKGEDIYLGPAVGVLVTPEYLSNLKSGKMAWVDKKLFEANEKGNCLLYYFTKENINLKDKVVYGVIFSQEKNRLEYVPMPLPQIVYEKIDKLSSTESMAYEYMKNILTRNFNIKYINSRTFLGKWEAFLALSKDENCKKYVPATISYDSFDDVLLMLEHFNTIFLKYAYGTRGKQVLSIERITEGYRTVYVDDKPMERIFTDIASLEKFTTQYISDRFFIISEGIPLIKLNDRRVDLRVMLDKNGEGKWASVGLRARIAEGNSTITNYCAGGKLTNYDFVYSSLKEVYGDVLPGGEQIVQDSIKMAECLERSFGSFGEFGMDIAVDEKGGIWFIEANVLPQKTPHPELETPEQCERKFLTVLEYSRFLAS